MKTIQQLKTDLAIYQEAYVECEPRHRTHYWELCTKTYDLIEEYETTQNTETSIS